jgi:hypothetical protein
MVPRIGRVVPEMSAQKLNHRLLRAQVDFLLEKHLHLLEINETGTESPVIHLRLVEKPLMTP